MLGRDPVHLAAIPVLLLGKAQEPAHLIEAEAEITAPPDEAQAVQMLGIIGPIVAGCARRYRQKADLLVIADRHHLGSGHPGEIAYRELRISGHALDPIVTIDAILSGAAVLSKPGTLMSAHCCNDHCDAPARDVRYRRVLWGALGINAAMFLTELVAGLAAGSASLQADALDFLADAANYGISLSVLGLALAWRARAALVKGVSMGLLGLWVAGSTLRHALMATVPEAHVMGIVGLLALLSNAGVALLLYRYRAGDANMRSVWICSRNDAIGNVAVLLAALGVFGTGTGWPDVIVAGIMTTLALWRSAQVVRQAAAELRGARVEPVRFRDDARPGTLNSRA